MTLKEIANRCNELIEKKPELAGFGVALKGDALYIAKFVEDEPASEENDWNPDGHWVYKDFVTLLERAE